MVNKICCLAYPTWQTAIMQCLGEEYAHVKMSILLYEIESWCNMLAFLALQETIIIVLLV